MCVPRAVFAVYSTKYGCVLASDPRRTQPDIPNLSTKRELKLNPFWAAMQ